MNYYIFSKLPFDIQIYILLFNKHFILRENKIICINYIKKNDFRYQILLCKPKIFKLTSNNYNVILGKTKRFVLGYRTFNDSLEYYFYTFEYDPIMKCMKEFPSNKIYGY